MQQVKILLDESDIPENWYNVVADMPNPPAPPLGPDAKPIGPEALAAIFPGAIIEQEVSLTEEADEVGEAAASVNASVNASVSAG